MEGRDPLTEKIIACCYEVHNAFGPGLNEKIYHKSLIIALKKYGLVVETEKAFNVFFQGCKVGLLRLDLVVNDRVVVEIKAVNGYLPEIFKYQILSYLKVSAIKVGLLVNFGQKSCQVKRFVN